MLGRWGLPAMRSKNASRQARQVRSILSSRRVARASFLGLPAYRLRAQGELGRASRSAPTTPMIGMNTPKNPVQYLPLSRQMTAQNMLKNTVTATPMPAPTPPPSVSVPTPRPAGLNPKMNSMPAHTAMITASTESLPSALQYTSCRRRIKANSSRVRATPAPNTRAHSCNQSCVGVVAISTMPMATMRTTPITMWCTCTPPSDSMSWNHQLTLARMRRVLARTPRKVRSSPSVNAAMAARCSPR